MLEKWDMQKGGKGKIIRFRNLFSIVGAFSKVEMVLVVIGLEIKRGVVHKEWNYSWVREEPVDLLFPSKKKKF